MYAFLWAAWDAHVRTDTCPVARLSLLERQQQGRLRPHTTHNTQRAAKIENRRVYIDTRRYGMTGNICMIIPIATSYVGDWNVQQFYCSPFPLPLVNPSSFCNPPPPPPPPSPPCSSVSSSSRLLTRISRRDMKLKTRRQYPRLWPALLQLTSYDGPWIDSF